MTAVIMNHVYSLSDKHDVNYLWNMYLNSVRLILYKLLNKLGSFSN